MTNATNQERIYLSPPHMSGRERELLLDAFDSNWIAPLGPHVNALEEEFAERLGGGYAVALATGTSALHLALLTQGVQPGDEVLCSTLTFAATVNAIKYCNAEPVFIDSERESWNLDPDLLQQELKRLDSLGKRPAAVVAVDVLGQCANYPAIAPICQHYGVPLIIDAAESLGATCAGQPAGVQGQAGCFSLNGNKIITASGGGLLFTKDKQRAERVRHLATQAKLPTPHYEHAEVGYNYRMSNLLAAVARGQLQLLDERVTARRANFDFYHNQLSHLPGVAFMPEAAFGRSTRWLTCMLFDSAETPTQIREALAEQNIESRPLWKPMHQQPAYAGCRSVGGQVADDLFARGLCLPSGSSLTQQQLERVAHVIKDTLRSSRKLEAA